MIYLIISVLCSVSLALMFRMFPKWGVNTFQAVVANYWTCFVTGSLVMGHFPVSAETVNEPWFPYSLLLSVLFITGFMTVALTIQMFGTAVASVMQKMSLILSVPFAVFFLGDASTPLKWLGLAVATAAVILVNWPQQGSEEQTEPKSKGFYLWFIPVYTFVASAAIEVLLSSVEKNILAPMGKSGDPSFLILLFGMAAVWGTLALIVGVALGKMSFSPKSIVAGVCLGVPNYASMYFLLLALSVLGSAQTYPLCNVSVILVISAMAYFFFKESLSKINLVGLALAILAILLIADF